MNLILAKESAVQKKCAISDCILKLMTLYAFKNYTFFLSYYVCDFFYILTYVQNW